MEIASVNLENESQVEGSLAVVNERASEGSTEDLGSTESRVLKIDQNLVKMLQRIEIGAREKIEEFADMLD